MITGSLILMPWGFCAGCPAIALDIDGRDGFAEKTGERLAQAIGRAMHSYPGASIVVIRAAPWADPELASVLDVGLQYVASVYATAPIGAKSWGYRDIPWLVDVSELVETAQSISGLRDAIQAIPGFPTPAEILARPALGMLSPATLDALAEGCGGSETMCHLVVPPEARAQAAYAVAKAESAWRLCSLIEPHESQLFAVA